ncbi:inositol 2-dehydrogenase [Mobiluncus mulieris]|uniref:Inositol 2-dehydrogenase n=2 Tax=Mobiluncus mulieris TaxID=2052 RepID=A0A2J9KN41_9ACTO|nr:inositol 2-dehydrogenase [Mobiluncus mulieris]EEJ52749.1 oxidoreductase, NAD-binding domain protein [Mobiluncus mulieris ATCC 35243]EEZ92050.1 oxidoreductase, NAD-binding domain protein [Mobiluncus mulieris 28-1]MCU9967947.1 inositol 2-dehydrogenase [Mobiluncus mulieris]MCU9970600.1 inositol 2-dehydrogenase [Mobiluncus mulieris]MCU9974983.1 inositol 2-dehydrogenase [Mobiluncus mulieris]
MVNIGLIGAGRIARVHANTIAGNPDARIVAIADPYQPAAKEIAERFGASVFSDAQDLFALDNLDAVVICSPTPQHPQHVVAAAQAGLPALCEKPVALSYEAAVKLENDLNGLNPKVMLGFNRRFDPSFAHIKKLVEAGEIGQVEQVTITSRDPEPPSAEYVASSGGIFKDMTIHDFDMARFFLGDIVEVFTYGQNFDPSIKAANDFDAAMILLRNAAGVVATIINSRHCAPGYDQRLEVFGADGVLNADNVRATTVQVAKKEFSASKEPYLNFFLERYTQAYTNELNTFLTAISKGETPTPGISDGIKALQIAEAAEESAKTGKSIKLS